ncbi:MAG: sulfite exporter TauE/SafE family protein [Betaproteobacteria bacterium]|nr:sulfite exporter TauE/SafE family protein [Betaproteobacteria bacterium]
MDWHFTLSGLLVGTIVGMTGVGGGSLMTPLLVMLFGIAPAVAIGTDLLYAGLTKAGGSVVHHRQRGVEWQIALYLALGSVPSATLTTLAIRHFGRYQDSVSNTMRFGLGVMLLISALSIFFRDRIHSLVRGGNASRWNISERTQNSATIGLGVVLGFLVTLTSVGAGALGAAALALLYPRLSTHQVVGTDIAHAVPLTLVAGAGHMVLGTVNYWLLVSLLLGSLPGIWLGSRYCGMLPERPVRNFLALVLLIIGGKLVWV